MAEIPTVASALDQAIDLLSIRWGQGHQLPEKSCLWYAVVDVAFGKADLYHRVMKAIVAELGIEAIARAAVLGQPNVLIRWNDAPERTKDEVLAVLRAARQTAQQGLLS